MLQSATKLRPSHQTAPVEPTGIELLPRSECRRLLAEGSIGRVVFTDEALPAIQPVAYTMDDDAIIAVAPLESRFGASVRTSVVAFEIDEVDAAYEHGWSVTALGSAETVTDDLAAARFGTRLLPSWMRPDSVRFVRITPRLLCGERLPGVRSVAT